MKKSLLFGKYALFLLLFSALAFASCKKDKDEEPAPPTKKELLSNKWKVADVKKCKWHQRYRLTASADNVSERQYFYAQDR